MAAKKKRTALRAPREPRPLTLTSVKVAEWEPLGSAVHLPISPRRTVLVGKNGAGKSLLLEGLHEARLRILHPGSRRGPVDFQCSLVDSNGNPLNYRYKTTQDSHPTSVPEDIENELQPAASWQEWCWGNSPESPFWQLSSGRASSPRGPDILMPPGTSLLSLANIPESELPEKSLELRQFFKRQRLVRAGLLREAQHREAILIPDQGNEPWS
jgi:hypothetical protein